jgi:hypothetical protein
VAVEDRMFDWRMSLDAKPKELEPEDDAHG